MQFREVLNMMGHNVDDRRKRDWRLRYVNSTQGLSATSQSCHSVRQPPDHEERITLLSERESLGLDLWTGDPLEFGE